MSLERSPATAGCCLPVRGIVQSGLDHDRRKVKRGKADENIWRHNGLVDFWVNFLLLFKCVSLIWECFFVLCSKSPSITFRSHKRIHARLLVAASALLIGRFETIFVSEVGICILSAEQGS